MQRKEAMMERERALNQRIQESQAINIENKNRFNQKNMKAQLGFNFDDINRVGGRIPGFNMLKDRVIKPLMVATEKVVEYYTTEEQNKIQEG